MARRARENDIAFGHMSFVDVLANSVGALTFLFLMFFIITSMLVTPSNFRLLTTSLPDSAVGTNYTVTLAVVGGVPPYTWKISGGSLPAGLQLDPKKGSITGSPAAAGNYGFKVRVKDSRKTGSSVLKRDLRLKITPAALISEVGNEKLRINTDSLPNATVGDQYNVTLAAVGGLSPYTWSIRGELPPGLALQEDKITGVPEIKGGWYFEIKAEDKQPTHNMKPVSLNIKSKPIITEDDLKPVKIEIEELPNAKVGSPYELALVAGGGIPPYTWSVVGGLLPDNLMLHAKTGTITGTPKKSGPSEFALTVSDSRNSISPKQNLSLRVEKTPSAVASDNLPLTWWIVLPATIGTILGLIFLVGLVIGVQCPWDNSWGCKIVGKDGRGRAIYKCKHGHRFVNEIKPLSDKRSA